MKYFRSITGFLALVFIVSMLGCTGLSTKDEGAPVPSSSEEPAITPTVEQPSDADGDGVADADDLCADTPAGTTVDASGCPVTDEEGTPTGATGIMEHRTSLSSVMTLRCAWEGTVQEGGDKNYAGSGIALNGSNDIFTAGYVELSAGIKRSAVFNFDCRGLLQRNAGPDLQFEDIIGPPSWAHAIAIDKFNDVYVAGHLHDGRYGVGYSQSYFVRYDKELSGQQRFEFTSAVDNHASGIRVDDDRNVYIVGHVLGARLDVGASSVGQADAYIVKFPWNETANSLSLDDRIVKQFGTALNDGAKAIALQDRGPVVVGYTASALPGLTHIGEVDAFVVMFSPILNPVKYIQFGTNERDVATGIDVNDLHYFFVVGTTRSALPGQSHIGLTDAFIQKYDPIGNLMKTIQFGTALDDIATSVVVDKEGSVYVTGYSNGNISSSFVGTRGRDDIFVIKYDSDLNEKWRQGIGTSQDDISTSIAVDKNSNIYITGSTKGGLDGNPATTATGEDLFIVKFNKEGAVQ